MFKNKSCAAALPLNAIRVATTACTACCCSGRRCFFQRLNALSKALLLCAAMRIRPKLSHSDVLFLPACVRLRAKEGMFLSNHV